MPSESQAPSRPSESRRDRQTLLFAWILALLISGGAALALYLNPEWRTSEFGEIVEEVDEEGLIQRKVKVDRPEPDEEQVREIARNQERKKREELKREAKKIVEVLRETEEIKERRKIELASKTADDEAFRLALEIEKLASRLHRSVRADPIMGEYETPLGGSKRVLEIATRLADKAREDSDGVLSPEEAGAQIEISEELVRISALLVETFERGRSELKARESDRRAQGRIERELRDEIDLSSDLLSKAEDYLDFIRDLLESRVAPEEEDGEELQALPELPSEQLAEIGEDLLAGLSEDRREKLEAFAAQEEAAAELDSELAEAAGDFFEQEELAALTESALAATDEASVDPDALSEEQMAALGREALDAYQDRAALEERLGRYADEALDQMPTNELYETIQDLGEQVNRNFTEARAAELAAAQSQSFEEAMEDLYQPEMPKAPDLSAALAPEAPRPTDAESFKSFNEALEQATRAASDIARTARSRASQLSGLESSQSGQLSGRQLSQMLRARSTLQAAMGTMASTADQPRGAMSDMTGLMAQAYQLSGGQSGPNPLGEGAVDAILNRAMFEGSMGASAKRQSQVLKDISTGEIVAQALPGRKFTEQSARKGWLFIDTWYVIGPWDRPRNAETSFQDKKFPPETLVDLDAEYSGKKHPRTGLPLDLKWRFVQSNNLRINPPDEITDSTYYAYTEVHSDRTREVLLAIGTDDYAKVWINDLPVWEEKGLSSWELDQGFRKILLKKGYNDILLRLESGPGVAYFSLMLCPVDI